MLAGETIRTGAPKTCPSCKVTPEFQVYSSNAGYYVGTYCNCGPYTRESEYYRDYETAADAMSSGLVRWRDQPSTRRVILHAYVEVPVHVSVDELLGNHRVDCIVSYNCDDYSGCIPAVIDVYHAHEPH